MPDRRRRYRTSSLAPENSSVTLHYRMRRIQAVGSSADPGSSFGHGRGPGSSIDVEQLAERARARGDVQAIAVLLRSSEVGNIEPVDRIATTATGMPRNRHAPNRHRAPIGAFLSRHLSAAGNKYQSSARDDGPRHSERPPENRPAKRAGKARTAFNRKTPAGAYPWSADSARKAVCDRLSVEKPLPT